MYKTEMHCHTARISACASVNDEDFVNGYVEAGYTTVVLTNHMNRWVYGEGNTKYPTWLGENGKEDCWASRMEYYIDGYKKLKELAKGKLNILLGMELRPQESDDEHNNNEYLLYGLTEDFLYANPDFHKLRFKEFIKLFHENGILVFQSHPFREGMIIRDPHQLDGVEVYNGSVHCNRNDIADLWADKYHLKKVSGSDSHWANSPRDAGILTETPIETMSDLMEVLKNGNYTLYRDNQEAVLESDK